MTPASPKIKTAARVSPYRVAHGLLGGARGSDSTQAPVELLSRSFGGRFTQPEQPCIVIDRSGQIGFNAEVLTEGSVGDARCRAASAGRRRCLDGRRQFGRSCPGLSSRWISSGGTKSSRHRGPRSFGLGPCCALGDESVQYQLRAT
jgi:hypothetical protein